MKSNPTKGTKVIVGAKAKVHPKYRGQSGFITKISYSSDKGFLYNVRITDVYDPDDVSSDLMATESDLLIFKD